MTTKTNTTPLRPIQVLLRSKDAIELYTLPDTSSSSSFSTTSTPNKDNGRVIYQGKSTFHLVSPTGNQLFVHDPSIGLLACKLTDGGSPSKKSAFLSDSQTIQMAKCSPRGSYLLTWQRPSSSSSSSGGGGVVDKDGNLKVWSASDGKLLKSLSCKKATLETLQWTHDEELAFHLVTNEIHVYSAQDGWRRVGKVRCMNVASFSLPRVRGYAKNVVMSSDGGAGGGSKRYVFTVFCPESKGKPARVDLLRYPDRMGRDSSTVVGGASPSSNNNNNNNSNTETSPHLPSGPALASKSLFHAEEVTVQWSPRADSALLLTQTAVDSTGESYYGSTHLFLLLETDLKDPSRGVVLSVPLPPEAGKDSNGVVPIVSAGWIPNPCISGPVPFGVISGKMPALASLHHGLSGEPTFLMGRAHRNVMDVSPHGRFVVCGGYGNLAGGMDFWDRNKGKMIPRHVVMASSSPNGDGAFVTMKEPGDLTLTSCSPVVGHQWAPDSRTYLVSTTSPRMNVENGVHVYRYDGTLIDDSKLPWDNDKYRPDKLLSAEYVPAPLAEDANNGDGEGSKEFYYYPDRPQSPPPRSHVELKGEDAEKALASIRQTQSNGKSNGKSPAVAAYVPPAARAGGGGRGGAYVPPGARGGAAGRSGGTSLAERMRQEREGSAAALTGKKVVKRTGPVGAASVGPVGSDPDSKSKNAVRREKQRLAKEKAEREAAEAEQRKKEEEAARAEANKLDPEKRAKKLRKTLKQIDEIKAKAEQGVELNEDQKMKLASEKELRKELASLGL
ncbi:hypothetical protein HJC23_007558 [Cyclotella cryptica]|uniref:Eukaryotic translation initiation factor 2A n=1 Tax=Cyclotella cryptica TaxID=29204 RepID=A0ABD3QUS8_9STRA|eukprot:CCRYP_002819-RA/>CCRYP_002819-RA protein AED:0.06 eAED:0.06 QI:0/-1/0/1/-1/1/1/0/782